MGISASTVPYFSVTGLEKSLDSQVSTTGISLGFHKPRRQRKNWASLFLCPLPLLHLLPKQSLWLFRLNSVSCKWHFSELQFQVAWVSSFSTKFIWFTLVTHIKLLKCFFIFLGRNFISPSYIFLLSTLSIAINVSISPTLDMPLGFHDVEVRGKRVRESKNMFNSCLDHESSFQKVLNISLSFFPLEILSKQICKLKWF
jgi:hypothetical protein